MKKFAIIAVCSAFLFTSCRPSKSVTKETSIKEKSKDSLTYKETVKLDTLKVAKESATVAFPFHLLKDSLLNYMEKSNGRAKVSIYRVKDTIYAEAQCDSLEKVILSRDKELYQWKQYAIEQSSYEKKVIVDVPLWFKLLQIGIVILGLGGIILNLIPHFKKFKT